MSTEQKLKRYILVEISGEQWMHEKENKMTPAKPGEFVSWEDYATLKAEVERLKKFSDEALAHIAKEERKSRERLDMVQAEVELLRKAGDAVCESPYLLETDPAVIAWRAAKEGNQP